MCLGTFVFVGSGHVGVSMFIILISEHPGINNSLGRGQQESSRFYLDSNGKFEFYFLNLK